MQLASSPALCEAPLAAKPQLSEKPHQGFSSKNPALHPGQSVCNFTTALGLQFCFSEIALGKTVDNIYRLNGETITGDPANNSGDNGSASYTLDPVGNRTAETSSLSGINPIAGSYNPNDQLTSETYDANGNTTQTANGNQYTYDSENHLIKMVNGTTVVTIQYDAFGNRVSKTVTTASGTVSTQYLVDDLNPTGYPQVVEELVNGAVTRQYTYGLQRISENLSPVVTGNSTWTPSFYGYDGFGSVRQLTNSSGVVTDSYEYDAFGNSFTKTGTTPNNYLYRGEQLDSDLGLYYLRARYMNPLTGRFLSRDPEDGYIDVPATLHKYLYAVGDPVNRRDPRGREELGDYEIDVEAGETIAEPAEEAVVDNLEEAMYKLETLEDYQAASQGPGYRIITQKTADFVEDLIDDFIKLYNAK